MTTAPTNVGLLGFVRFAEIHVSFLSLNFPEETLHINLTYAKT